MIHHQHHHLIAIVQHLLAGGLLGLIGASLAMHFGWRSADRLPGESRWPQCIFCLKQLTWQEVLPLSSWLLRPNARALPCPCGIRSGLWPQPAAELTGFLLGFVGMWLSGWTLMAAPLCLGLGLLPAIALIDLHFGLIPDELNLLVGLTGFGYVAASDGDIYFALITAGVLLALGLFLALVYSRWRGREMLGLGDVKFFAAAGLWLQPETAPWFLGMAGIFGVIFNLVWQRLGGEKESPFAPSLCLALAICVFVQLNQMP